MHVSSIASVQGLWYADRKKCLCSNGFKANEAKKIISGELDPAEQVVNAML